MRRRARPGGGRQVEVSITAIGARGDGIAEAAGRPLFVPFTVPGDRVRARLTGERAGALKGEAVELIAEGPGRVEPPCPHFGSCGGCTLQHFEDGRYAKWKAELSAEEELEIRRWVEYFDLEGFFRAHLETGSAG